MDRCRGKNFRMMPLGEGRHTPNLEADISAIAETNPARTLAIVEFIGSCKICLQSRTPRDS